jgi:hypothetical protein
MTQQEMTPFRRLYARIEGSDIETEQDSLAITELIKKRDQMCSDLTIGRGINPEGVERVFKALEAVLKSGYYGTEEGKEAIEALTAAKL